ncbi:MAG TPA: hypothetical protein VG963_17135 [Polyangiaceae bacterium]|nr:hypothetical protein [Polyangiaceae bacterium]
MDRATCTPKQEQSAASLQAGVVRAIHPRLISPAQRSATHEPMAMGARRVMLVEQR